MFEVNGHGDIELGSNFNGVLHVTSRHEFTPGIVNVSGEVGVTPDEFFIVVLDMEALADQAQSLEQPRLFGEVLFGFPGELGQPRGHCSLSDDGLPQAADPGPVGVDPQLDWGRGRSEDDPVFTSSVLRMWSSVDIASVVPH